MKNYSEDWEAVIGLEIHVQLSTKSKLFSGASTDFGALPNTQACNIDLAMPGVLPVLNEEVLRMLLSLERHLMRKSIALQVLLERTISIRTRPKVIRSVKWINQL